MQRAPRSVDAIVEQQVQKWLQERRATPPPRPAPVISVSRQFGAQGAELARRVADALGYHLWDQEILHEIARHAQVSERMVAAFDEHHRASVVETVRSMMRMGPLSASEYFHELARLVHSIAAHGAAVLVGRGVQYLLPASTVLRVRVIASLDVRVRGLRERRGLSDAEARAEIATVDADRAAFMRDHYGRDLDDPTAYDLLVNTGTVPLDRAASLVIAAYDARFPDVRPTAHA
jgi:cytidylate kinase